MELDHFRCLVPPIGRHIHHVAVILDWNLIQHFEYFCFSLDPAVINKFVNKRKSNERLVLTTCNGLSFLFVGAYMALEIVLYAS